MRLQVRESVGSHALKGMVSRYVDPLPQRCCAATPCAHILANTKGACQGGTGKKIEKFRVARPRPQIADFGPYSVNRAASRAS